MATSYLRSGELARLTGVSTDTLRHYERSGVLGRPGRTSAGYRQYPPEAVHRVRLVRGALAVGFTLEELARVLRVRDGGGAPCRQVYELASRKLVEFDQQIAELTALRGRLRSIVERWESRLERTPEGQRAGLLESLMQPSSGKSETNETQSDGRSDDDASGSGGGDRRGPRRPAKGRGFPRRPRNGLLA